MKDDFKTSVNHMTVLSHILCSDVTSCQYKLNLMILFVKLQ